ncbi:hypothetical protein FI667_g7658, partial [Globisporangium splendens]
MNAAPGTWGYSHSRVAALYFVPTRSHFATAVMMELQDSINTQYESFMHSEVYTLSTALGNPNSRLKRARSLVVSCKVDEDGSASEDSSASKTAIPPTNMKSSRWSRSRWETRHVVVLPPSGTAMPASKQYKRSYLVNRNSPTMSPLETCIHLAKDWQQRRDVLLAMRDRKIDVARRFLSERTRFIDPFQECNELSRYITPEGDFCTIKMDVSSFEGVKSVRQVFNVMHFYMANLEITMTEMSGNVTVLENDENTETSVLHYCLATAERDDVLVENNCVVFLDTSGLDCGSVEEQNALVTADFVDRDDLFPYCPSQRLRKDSTSVMKLSAYRRERVGVVTAGGDGESIEEEDELVVVLTRWFLVRMRRPEIAVPEPVLRSITDNLAGCFDLMVKYIREGLHPSSTTEQSES